LAIASVVRAAPINGRVSAEEWSSLPGLRPIRAPGCDVDQSEQRADSRMHCDWFII
jgi:hypothetical protein